MAAVEDSGYTMLSRREIAASGLGTDPKVIAAFEGLQNAAFLSNPAATEAAQAAADTAGAAAAAADSAAAAAAAAASTAGSAATSAQTTANDAFGLAQAKAAKSTGASWAAPSGTATRSTLASYTAPTISNPPTQAEVQTLANAVQALSQALVAVITDLRATEALKP